MKKISFKLSRTVSTAALFAAILFFALYSVTRPTTITIFVDGKKVVTKTKAILVREALGENRITISSKDYVTPALDSCIADSDGIIVVRKAKKAVVFKRGFRESIYFYSANLSSFKQELGIKNSQLLSFSYSRNVKNGMVVYAEPLREVASQYLVYFDERGRIVSKKDGAGIKRIRLKKLYRGDTLIASTIIAEEILKKPAVAARKKPVARSRRSVSRGTERTRLPNSNALLVVATAYAPGAGAGYITATGRRAGYGIVAVDPRVIPLGTRLYIPGYGYGVAADTGSAIKGLKIDLCFNTRSEAIRWGRRKVTVYILSR